MILWCPTWQFFNSHWSRSNGKWFALVEISGGGLCSVYSCCVNKISLKCKTQKEKIPVKPDKHSGIASSSTMMLKTYTFLVLFSTLFAKKHHHHHIKTKGRIIVLISNSCKESQALYLYICLTFELCFVKNIFNYQERCFLSFKSLNCLCHKIISRHLTLQNIISIFIVF